MQQQNTNVCGHFEVALFLFYFTGKARTQNAIQDSEWCMYYYIHSPNNLLCQHLRSYYLRGQLSALEF